MPTLFTQAWGTNSQSYSISPTALAHDSAIVGAALDLSGLTAVQDVLIFIAAKASATVGSDKLVNWFACGSVDGGTTYTGSVTSTTYTTFSGNLVQYPNVIFGRPVACQDTTQNYGGPFSLALMFGGVLPKFIKLGLHNRTNVALTSSNTENAISYQVVYTQA